MNGNELLDKMEWIDPAYIEAADAQPEFEKKRRIRWGALAACVCLAIAIAVPAMAAAIPAFYEALYAVSPVTAQFFRPVQRSCEDNGVRMEVLSAYIHENTAEIYISMRDLSGVGLDATTDLFDSYRIHTPFGSEGYCQLSSFDPDTKTATFLIAIRQRNGQRIAGDKLTFSVRKLLFNKQSTIGVVENVDLASMDINTQTQIVRPRGVSAIDFAVKSDAHKDYTVLKPDGAIASPADGVTLTGIGYVDGRLHIQVYYADILNTDNHGEVYLFNRRTEARIAAHGCISFFDDSKNGSYEDYIFSDISKDTLGDYVLYGDFTTASPALEGNWSVTFPLENTESE